MAGNLIDLASGSNHQYILSSPSHLLCKVFGLQQFMSHISQLYN